MSTENAASSGASERTSFLLRLDPAIHDALARWAVDELRSTHAQILFLLRRALDSRTEHLSHTRRALALPGHDPCLRAVATRAKRQLAFETKRLAG